MLIQEACAEVAKPEWWNDEELVQRRAVTGPNAAQSLALKWTV